MKAKIDLDLCTGCGVCAEICPRVFEVPDDLAIVLLDPVPEDLEDDCREAADDCPVEAIIIEE